MVFWSRRQPSPDNERSSRSHTRYKPPLPSSDPESIRSTRRSQPPALPPRPRSSRAEDQNPASSIHYSRSTRENPSSSSRRSEPENGRNGRSTRAAAPPPINSQRGQLGGARGQLNNARVPASASMVDRERDGRRGLLSPNAPQNAPPMPPNSAPAGGVFRGLVSPPNSSRRPSVSQSDQLTPPPMYEAVPSSGISRSHSTNVRPQQSGGVSPIAAASTGRQRANSHASIFTPESLDQAPPPPYSARPALPPRPTVSRPPPSNSRPSHGGNSPTSSSNNRRSVDLSSSSSRPTTFDDILPPSQQGTIDSEDSDDLNPSRRRNRLIPPSSSRHIRSRSASHSGTGRLSTLIGNMRDGSTAQQIMSTDTARTIQRKAEAAVAAVTTAARNHSTRRTNEGYNSDDSDWGMGKRRPRHSRISVFTNQPTPPRRTEPESPLEGSSRAHRRNMSVNNGKAPATQVDPSWMSNGPAKTHSPCKTCGAAMMYEGEGGNAFMCKGCDMVNDLKLPMDGPDGVSRQKSFRIARKPIGNSSPVTPPPAQTTLDIEATQALVHSCLQAFLGPIQGPQDFQDEDSYKRIFQPLETFLSQSFFTAQCLNSSFGTVRGRSAAPAGPIATTPWSPEIDWKAVLQWYEIVINCASSWYDVFENLPVRPPLDQSQLEKLERVILAGQERVQKALLKYSEKLLRRPYQLFDSPDSFRFLFILLRNPLLQIHPQTYRGFLQDEGATTSPIHKDTANGEIAPLSSYHSVVIKRIVGLLINGANQSMQAIFTQWLTSFSPAHFQQTREIVTSLLVYRLRRSTEKNKTHTATTFDELLSSDVPQMSREPGQSANNLAATLATIQASRNRGHKSKQSVSDSRNLPVSNWQFQAACRLLNLLWTANTLRRPSSENIGLEVSPSRKPAPKADTIGRHGQIVPTNDFYVPYLDLMDIMSEFQDMISPNPRPFNVCNYAFLFGITQKRDIIDQESKLLKAEAQRNHLLNSLVNNRPAGDVGLIMHVRRTHIVQDSLAQFQRAFCTPILLREQLKVTFEGEDGLDYGGLRKDWFMNLTREMFSPRMGLFIHDERSQLAYFNPDAEHRQDEYRMLGAVFGLAIYNNCILNVPLPSFVFNHLLGSAPLWRNRALWPKWVPTLADLAELNPSLASGLQQLLNYEGDDFEEVFDLTFEIQSTRRGRVVTTPLVPNGSSIPVTLSNRHDYVRYYLKHHLITAPFSSSSAFHRGFYSVFSNRSLATLSLCQPEEVARLICGSPEPLNIPSLRAVAVYDNWAPRMIVDAPVSTGEPNEPVVRWFWEAWERANEKDQRKLLAFITGTDRVPAGGAAGLVLKIMCLGDDQQRLPSARTCFNTLALYRYRTREALQRRLWIAVKESEGFGLK